MEKHINLNVFSSTGMDRDYRKRQLVDFTISRCQARDSGCLRSQQVLQKSLNNLDYSHQLSPTLKMRFDPKRDV